MTATSANAASFPPVFPVSARTFIPLALAVTAAYRIFSALPDVLIPRNTSFGMP